MFKLYPCGYSEGCVFIHLSSRFLSLLLHRLHSCYQFQLLIASNDVTKFDYDHNEAQSEHHFEFDDYLVADTFISEVEFVSDLDLLSRNSIFYMQGKTVDLNKHHLANNVPDFQSLGLFKSKLVE